MKHTPRPPVNRYQSMRRSPHAAVAKAARLDVKAIALAMVLAVAAAIALSSHSHARPAPDSFADLAEELLPAVVNISTTQTVEARGDLPQGVPDFFREFFERRGGGPQQEGRPRQRQATSLGSGFVIDAKEGYVVTNNHVIQDAEEIKVILQDNTALDAEMLGSDPKTDIALLKVEIPKGLKLQQVSLGSSDKMRVGDWVMAIGNPFGLGGSVTAGIISARGRNIQAGPYDDFIQTDASINKGNSGGPLFNLDGEVIGINTAIYSPSGGSVGIGFAVPSNIAKTVIADLKEFGRTRRGWLGVRIQTVSEEIAENLGLDEASGALVTSINPDGPAQDAGIEKGDVILSFNGKKVPEMRKLPRIVAETNVGQTVDVDVWRDRKKITLKVKVGELEEAERSGAIAESRPVEKTSATLEEMGLSIGSIDEEMRDRFDLSDDVAGVVIVDVDPDGPAAEKGLRPGHVITEIAQEEVSTPEAVRAALDKALKAKQKSILLLIEGEGGVRYVAVKLDAE